MAVSNKMRPKRAVYGVGQVGARWSLSRLMLNAVRLAWSGAARQHFEERGISVTL